MHLAYGEHLRRARRREQAQTHLVTAADIFEQLGAAPWLNRAVGEVRAMGLPTSRTAVIAPAAPLTPQELQIANLAAAGLTNRQIGTQLHLSHRTIGAHLYRIYPKLGVSSRAALRDTLGRLP